MHILEKKLINAILIRNTGNDKIKNISKWIKLMAESSLSKRYSGATTKVDDTTYSLLAVDVEINTPDNSQPSASVYLIYEATNLTRYRQNKLENEKKRLINKELNHWCLSTNGKRPLWVRTEYLIKIDQILNNTVSLKL